MLGEIGLKQSKRIISKHPKTDIDIVSSTRTWFCVFSACTPSPMMASTRANRLLLPFVSGWNDLLAKCVYSAFSHYYPQYDPGAKGLMVENVPLPPTHLLPPAPTTRLHREIIGRIWERLARVSSCFAKEVISWARLEACSSPPDSVICFPARGWYVRGPRRPPPPPPPPRRGAAIGRRCVPNHTAGLFSALLRDTRKTRQVKTRSEALSQNTICFTSRFLNGLSLNRQEIVPHQKKKGHKITFQLQAILFSPT